MMDLFFIFVYKLSKTSRNLRNLLSQQPEELERCSLSLFEKVYAGD